MARGVDARANKASITIACFSVLRPRVMAMTEASVPRRIIKFRISTRTMPSSPFSANETSANKASVTLFVTVTVTETCILRSVVMSRSDTRVLHQLRVGKPCTPSAGVTVTVDAMLGGMEDARVGRGYGVTMSNRSWDGSIMNASLAAVFSFEPFML